MAVSTCFPVHSGVGFRSPPPGIAILPGGGARRPYRAPGEIHQRQVHQLLELSAVEERVAFRQQHARAHVILNQTAEGFPSVGTVYC